MEILNILSEGDRFNDEQAFGIKGGLSMLDNINDALSCSCSGNGNNNNSALFSCSCNDNGDDDDDDDNNNNGDDNSSKP